MIIGSTEVLISLREPYNKNTFWIHPHDNIIECKVFDKGWKTIFTTEDSGLSTLSLKQVESLIKTLRTEVIELIKKHLGKYTSNSLVLIDREKKLESRINELENKIEKLTKRYSTLSSKRNYNGRK